jgi:hypothetical protein
VFAGRGGRPVSGLTDIREAVRAGAAVEGRTLHDFRRTIVSALGDHGFEPQVADGLLNHVASSSMPGVMGVYQRSEMWGKRREAMDLWARLLMEAVGRVQGRAVDPETWGFDTPFEETRIRRDGRRPTRQAARSAAGSTRTSEARAQASSSSAR